MNARPSLKCLSPRLNNTKITLTSINHRKCVLMSKIVLNLLFVKDQERLFRFCENFCSYIYIFYWDLIQFVSQWVGKTRLGRVSDSFDLWAWFIADMECKNFQDGSHFPISKKTWFNLFNPDWYLVEISFLYFLKTMIHV